MKLDIVVKNVLLTEFRFSMNDNDKINDLKGKLAEKLEINLNEIEILYNGIIWSDEILILNTGINLNNFFIFNLKGFLPKPKKKIPRLNSEFENFVKSHSDLDIYFLL